MSIGQKGNMKLCIVGTRPETIKLYPFSKFPGFKFLWVNQSKDLKQDIIKFDYECEEWEIDRKIEELSPSMVLVQGDTRTAFRGAVCAFEKKIPVAHIEAGMRTFDLTQPFPEEAYRQMIDCIATYKFCSTEEAVKNCGGVYVGQTSIDTLYDFLPDTLEEDFYIVTVHRNEANISVIIDTLKKMDQTKLHIYAHPNKIGQELKKYFTTRDSLPYIEFVKELAKCRGCISDSGGLQEECIALGKDFISLREKSERGHGEKYERGATEKIYKILEDV